jgi:7-carboxy-7-deazaguanine synthase
VTYVVREMFYSLQGEGANSGRAAVFCRFSGCNLWTGREEDRTSAICRFCDTDFIGTGPDGGRFPTAHALVDSAEAIWPNGSKRRFVVLTGGEPMLQVDGLLIDEFHRRGFEVAVETNGTLPTPRTIDWICVSPKGRTRLAVRCGNELKLVYPQEGVDPEHFEDLSFEHFFLQPMDSPGRDENTRRAVEFCLQNPKWRLSLQTHKVLGMR